MSLQIQYSKEIAEQLGKVAVYLPGQEIEVGDIIKFPYGRIGLFNKKVPFGSFTKITSLKNLGVKYVLPELSTTPDNYKFTSKESVVFDSSVSSDSSFNVDTLPNVKGAVKIQFTSEGAIFFLAIGCNQKKLDDIVALEKEINSKGKNLVWEDTYLVTSVTIAQRAFIAQSQSKSSEIILEGDVSLIDTEISKINLQASLGVTRIKGDAFIKDWSDNVTVFMELVKFEKEVFEKRRGTVNEKELQTGTIVLKKVDINEIITENK